VRINLTPRASRCSYPNC